METVPCLFVEAGLGASATAHMTSTVVDDVALTAPQDQRGTDIMTDPTEAPPVGMGAACHNWTKW